MSNDINTLDPAEKEKRIAEIEALVITLEKTLVVLVKAFNADNVVTPAEKKALVGYKTYLGEVKYRLNSLKNPALDSDDAGDISKEMGTKKYFNDDYFKRAFKQSIKDWTQDRAIGLNSVRTYMIEQTEPAGLSAMDAVSVVLLIFPPGKAIKGIVTAAVTLAPIIEKAFNTSLGGSSKPSLNEIHVAWAKTLSDLATNDNAINAAYDAFTAEWKKNNKLEANVDWTWTNLFGPACSNFSNEHMPKGSVVEKAFLTKVIAAVEDSNDWDTGLEEGMADSGTAEIFFNDYGDKISFKNGQLDDVPSGLMKAIKTVYKGAKITDLPVSIHLTILSHEVNDFMIGGGTGVRTTSTTCVRVSNKAGGRDIKHKSGDKSVFERFQKQGCIDNFKISQLSVDT